MKFINKSTSIQKDGDVEGCMTYCELLLFVLNNSAIGKGMTLGEMKERLEVRTLLQDVELDAEVELDKGEHRVLKDVFKNHRWQVIHEDIVAIGDAIEVDS